MPPAGARGCAERAVHHHRRHRVRVDRAVRRADPDAEHRPAGRRRAAVHQLHHDGVVLADAVVPGDRPQPPLGGDGEHPRAGHRLPGLQRPPAAEQGRRSRRCCTSTATRASASASGTTRRRRRRRSPGRTTAGRPGRCSASTASTASSAATRISGIRSCSSTASRSISRALPDDGLPPVGGPGRPGDQLDRASTESVAPRQAVADVAGVRGDARAASHLAASGRTGTRAMFDMGWDAYREQTLARQKEMGIVPEHSRAGADARRASSGGTTCRPTSSACSPAWPSCTPATWSTRTRRSAG